jgi:hypothetical protein
MASPFRHAPESRLALVLVHLSSLDNYADFARDEIGDTDFDIAYALAGNIAEAIEKHKGPIYIIDQNWYLMDDESKPREWLLAEIDVIGRPITWIEFDEQDQPWKPFLEKLGKRLEKDGVTSVKLGGVFFEEGLRTGCVTAVYLHLRRLMPAKVDPEIVGCESDYGVEYDPKKPHLPRK